MAQAGRRGERKSSIASGWTVQADPAETVDPEPSGDPDASAVGRSAPAGSAVSSRPGAAAGLAGTAEPIDAAGTEHRVGPAEAAEDAAAAETAEPAGQLSNLALVLLGVFGGLYLLYAWIWLSWAQFYAETSAALAENSGSLGAVLQQVVFWAAPLAPILWFLSVLLLNRGAGTARLALWIGVGVVVLLPYPIFSGGGAA